MSSQVFWNLTRVDPLTLTFQIKPTQVAYANTLRRMILTGVESVAFRSDMNDKGSTTDVTVISNTTPMTNEMLADRIGLLPLHVEDPSTWNPEEYAFRLRVTNDSTDPKDVTASDFEVLKMGLPGEDPVVTGNLRFFQPNPVTRETCLIAVLKGHQANQNPQKIELTAKATVGTGRDHIRFSPISQCSYSYSLDTDEAKQKALFEKWLVNNKKVEPKSIEGDSDRTAKLQREFQTMEIQRCFLINEKGEPYSFDFVVESIGVQPVEKIIEKALVNLIARCTKYTSLEKGNLPETMRIQPAEARMKGFDLIFQNEDHTIGNLFQTWMEDNLMDTEEITYVGYKVPHPLRDEMVLRVGVDDGQELTARLLVSKAASGCVTMFTQWLEDWRRSITKPIGTRSRASLKPTSVNAKALAEYAESQPVAPVSVPVSAAVPSGRKSVWGKRGAKV